MFIKWEEIKSEAPMVIQIIERATGYRYDPAYGVLVKDGRQIISTDLFRFFDDHGWYCQVYKMHDDYWNAVITDSVGNTLYSDAQSFEAAEIKSRDHATSMIFNIALRGFEERLRNMIHEKKYTSVFRMSLIETAEQKPIDQIQISDLVADARGLLLEEELAILWDDVNDVETGMTGVVIKNKNVFPFVGMTVKI